MKRLVVIASMLVGGQLLAQTGEEQYASLLRCARTYKAEILHILCHDKNNKGAYSKSSDVLMKVLTKSIFPAWYGTPWDFNGISNVPNEGEIACGYFVSTTLKHVGFNLNRYRLAQQAASVIVEAICDKSNTVRFQSLPTVIQYLKGRKDGLYVVGIDYHVGFLVVDNNEAFFVHSDYYQVKVHRELAATCQALNDATIFVLGEITHNPKLMSKWLADEKVY